MPISFLFLYENICCGYSLEEPHWGASNEYSQHMFSWRNKVLCEYPLLSVAMTSSKTHKPSLSLKWAWQSVKIIHWRQGFCNKGHSMIHLHDSHNIFTFNPMMHNPQKHLACYCHQIRQHSYNQTEDLAQWFCTKGPNSANTVSHDPIFEWNTSSFNAKGINSVHMTTQVPNICK